VKGQPLVSPLRDAPDTPRPAAARPAPALEIWAGQDGAKEVASLAKKDLDARFGQGSTQAEDNLQGGGFSSSANTFTQVVTAAGVFVMLLGALSLVNISLVTVRQRIHEIGVRRSFGATSRRIFFSIMLESVVATVVAGGVGGAGRLLRGRRADNGRWAVVSGIPEPGEQPAVAIRRECLEETGVDVEVLAITSVTAGEPFAFPNGDNCVFMDINFVGRARPGSSDRAHVADDESTQVGWFAPDALPEPLLSSTPGRIEAALAWLADPTSGARFHPAPRDRMPSTRRRPRGRCFVRRGARRPRPGRTCPWRS